MGFKTRGMVVGHNAKRTDSIKMTNGDVFTQVEATNAEQGGTYVIAKVYPDGHGEVEVRVNRVLVHSFYFDPAGEAVA